MSRMSRTKGKLAQWECACLLAERDWRVHESNSGTATEDMIAFDPAGRAWSVEVKFQKLMNPSAWKAQAIRQADAMRLPWMLCAKIQGEGAWLILRKGEPPAIWRLRGRAE